MRKGKSTVIEQGTLDDATTKKKSLSVVPQKVFPNIVKEGLENRQVATGKVKR